MPRHPRSNPLALAVLACLVQRPMHPYEMATTMREQQQDSAIKLSYGSLYNVVRALREAEFIKATDTDRNGNRPERTSYAITAAGRVEMTRWLRQLLSEPVKEHTKIGAGLTFMTGLSPDDARDQLARRAQRLAEQIEQARAALQQAQAPPAGQYVPPRVFLVEDEYVIAMKEAELAWVNGLVAGITDGTLDGIDGWREHYARLDEQQRDGALRS